MHVHWSTVALERVIEAAEYAGRDDPEAGERLIEGLFAAAERLAQFPHSGRVVPELKREDTREIFHGRSRIIYRVRAERVEVLTVCHMRQMLGPEDVDPQG